MNQPIHRNRDLRNCGATTTVIGQTTVFANGKLVSVNGDPNTDGDGELIAHCKNVYAGGKMVVIVTNQAAADDKCLLFGGNHCDPIASQGSGNVIVGE